MPKVLLLLVLVVVAIAVGFSLGLLKNPLQKKSAAVPEVQLKTEYQNPFDKDTQYTNPFSEYKNPFDSLE